MGHNLSMGHNWHNLSIGLYSRKYGTVFDLRVPLDQCSSVCTRTHCKCHTYGRELITDLQFLSVGDVIWSTSRQNCDTAMDESQFEIDALCVMMIKTCQTQLIPEGENYAMLAKKYIMRRLTMTI